MPNDVWPEDRRSEAEGNNVAFREDGEGDDLGQNLGWYALDSGGSRARVG